tara:strand:+ start:258 stop:386 length:129 start_codon:yes stop_codon:yes gene_type:complete
MLNLKYYLVLLHLLLHQLVDLLQLLQLLWLHHLHRPKYFRFD